MKLHFNAAAVQYDIRKGSVAENLETVFHFLETLSKKQVRLAALPEMFTCSFDNENLKAHAQVKDEIIAKLSLFARTHEMAITGSMPEIKNEAIFNTMFFIDTDGDVKGSYRKLHLFRLTGEHLYYKPGKDIAVLETTLGRIGLMICYDLRFPELARSLFDKGAELIIVPAQWPSPRKAHWETLIRARAIENQLYMIGANRTGHEDELDFPGMSMVVDPLGNVIDSAGTEAGFAVAHIDPDQVGRFRKQIPCSSDRRPDIYG